MRPAHRPTLFVIAISIVTLLSGLPYLPIRTASANAAALQRKHAPVSGSRKITVSKSRKLLQLRPTNPGPHTRAAELKDKHLHSHPMIAERRISYLTGSKNQSSMRRGYLPYSMGEITVNTTTDDSAYDYTTADTTSTGTVSLRSAIQYTNYIAGQDTIVVPDGSYYLTLTGADEDSGATGDLDINDSLVILGSSETGTEIFGDGDRVFDVGPLDSSIAVTFKHLTVTQGNAPGSESGGGILVHGQSVELDTVGVVFNSAGGYGGGLEIHDGTTFSMAGGSLSYNTADANTGGGHGGGADILGGTASFTGVLISHDVADNGGGIQNEGNNPVTSFSYCTFVGDSALKAYNYGGGLDNDDGDFTADHCTFKQNYGNGDGGAFDIDAGNNVISNCVIDSNYSPNNDGAIYAGGKTIRMINDTVRWNSAPAFDGAIGAYPDSSFFMEGGVVAYNSCTNGSGGGILISTQHDTLVDVSIFGNSAHGNGGGIFNSVGTSFFKNVIMHDNVAGSNGGGIDDSSGGTIWSGGSLTYNSAAGEGGGIYLESAVASSDTLVNVTLAGNTPDAYYTNSGSYQVVILDYVIINATSIVDSIHVRLNATVYPYGSDFTVRFLYGTTSGHYTDSVYATPSTATGSSGVPDSTVIAVNPGAEYYYAVSLTGSDNYYFQTSELHFTAPVNITIVKEGADFEDDVFPPTGWTVSANSSGSPYYWSQDTASGYGVGHYSAYFDCYDDTAQGEFDSLLTPVITNLDSTDFVTFDYAYSGYPGYSDSLIVAVSTDGGATFSRVWYDGAPRLETTPEDNNAFIPGSSQWSSAYIHLPSGVEGSNVVVAFICENDFGNALYIDNIKIGSAPSDLSLAVQATDFGAESDAGAVTLSWKTQSEVDNAGFNVMRQELGVSGWQLAGSYVSDKTLQGLGTSSSGRSYSFTDNKVISGQTYNYKIQSVSTYGTTKDLSTLTVTVNVPKNYALYQNYPNPFNPSTTIRFDLKQASNVTLEIYNTLGQRVEKWSNGVMGAGRYNEVVNMSRYA
ncbi:MAG TPA: choice-of-anchor J domain-containing protein, partial [Candidatus Kryptonia bacterium]